MPTKRKRRLSASSNATIPDVGPKGNKTKIKKKHCPKFRLKKTAGELASLETTENDRVPLLLTDIQHLLLHSLLGNLNLSQAPRWYVLDKCSHITQTTCLVVEGLSIHEMEKHKAQFAKTYEIFNDFVEVLTPVSYGGSLVDELALVPLSEADKESIIQKYGSIDLALEARRDLNVMMRAVFPIQNEADNSATGLQESFPRTQLIMSAWQLIEENYPLPLKGKLEGVYSDYVMTKDEYHPVTSTSPMFGLDCEMCITNAGSELTRISIVNDTHETVYETLVKPYNNITDYLTRYSGVTKAMLDDVNKRLEDVQKDIKELLPPDAILVGQSLNSDLHALKMMHPYIIDTSLIFNFTGERSRKPKLKTLAKELLNEDIQTGKKGHCSVEDSLASLKLVQLKLSKFLEFGDAVHTNRKSFKDRTKTVSKTQQVGVNIFNHIIEQKKTSAVIGCDNITGDYHTYLTQAKESVITQMKKNKPKKIKLLTVDNTEEVVEKLCDASDEYNFAMAHLKVELGDDELTVIETVDKWIETVWSRLGHAKLFVVIFSGTASHNGVSMMKVKNI